jgi:hypothetical protein
MKIFAMTLKEILTQVVESPELHARFLNTLSLMENTGARKISASEDKESVTYIVLKHAAEEARHAFYLKKQISKIADITLFSTYEKKYLIAPFASYAYLHWLDWQVCRYLKNELNYTGTALKYGAYLLVTYAIEVRADGLYPVYQEVLGDAKSKVNVKSIIAEEEGHLEEMIHQLELQLPDWQKHAQKACEAETILFENWVSEISKSIHVFKSTQLSLDIVNS